MEIKNSNINSPRYLSNLICEEDLFEGKSHEAIANCISSTIKNYDIKMIGVDGGWGTGKSNLIQLVRKSLEKDNYRFFIYDAWGHQDDLQRRSILEELTDFIIDEDGKGANAVIDYRKWKKKLRYLLAKKKETTTKDIPKLSSLSIICILLIVLTPIFSEFSTFIPVKYQYYKPILTALPLIVGIIYVICFKIKNWKREKEERSSFTSELFYIYTAKTEERTSLETISEDEPSSKEFKKWMSEIDDDLKKHKLILVFDNMDRLPSKKVQELWAAIHSFFSDKTYNNITVIVPFDRAHIISAFKNEDNGSTPEKNCYGDDFINKTFNVVYRVSPPTMSNWKQYFKDRWFEAFGERLSDNSRITQIYDLLSDKQTPRKIIAFINEFVTIKQIPSSGPIPDEYIALFIFGKTRIELNPNKEILSPTYLGPLEYLYKNDENLQKYMCALYYQLPAEKALDIVYTNEITRALNGNDTVKMNELKELSMFSSLLENSINQITHISNSVNVLKNCLIDHPENSPKYWDCIYRKIETPYEKKLQDYQVVLLQEITSKEKYLREIIDSYYLESNYNIIDYFENINELSKIQGIEPFKYLKDKEVSPEDFVNVELVNLAKRSYDDYKIHCDETKLLSYLTNLDVASLGKINILPFIKDEYRETCLFLEDHLLSLIDVNSSNIDLLEILYSRLKEITQPVKKIISYNDIYKLLNDPINKSHPFYLDLICMSFARANEFQPPQNGPINAIWESIPKEKANIIDSILEFYINYDTILLNTITLKVPFYKTVVENITKYRHKTSKGDIKLILEKYTELIDNIEISPQDLLNKIRYWEVNDLNINNIQNIPIRFFSDTIENDYPLVIHCKNLAEKYLQGLLIEEWEESIQKNDYSCQLFNVIKPSANMQHYFDAIKNLLISYAKGEISTLDKNEMNNAIEWAKLNKRKLLSLFNNVRDTFCHNVNMNLELFDFYGEWLFLYSDLGKKKEVLRTIFKSEILDKNENIDLMLAHKDKMYKVVFNAGDEAQDFKDKIAQLLSEKYLENKEFSDFAKSIGIEPFIKEEEILPA